MLDYLKKLKETGRVRHIGFSSHTPSVAKELIGTGLIDMAMFSINPAYDMECGDEYGIGTSAERSELFRLFETERIGVSVMKPFHGGQLLSEKTSPFGHALTREQCIKYALDRPAVLTVVPGVRGLSDLRELLGYLSADDSATDYSVIGQFSPDSAVGSCVYCNHCQPCPAGIDIGLVNKYYDLAMAGDAMAYDHYGKLRIKADACLKCRRCDDRCPFGVRQQERMNTICNYFSKGEENND